MNNNTKSYRKSLTKSQRRASATLGYPMRNTKPKVAANKGFYLQKDQI
jgi:hypothetical protein